MKKAIVGLALLLSISASVNSQTYSSTIPDAEVEAALDQLVADYQQETLLKKELIEFSDDAEIVESRVYSSGIREDLKLAFYGWMKWNGVIYKGLYDINIILQAKGW